MEDEELTGPLLQKMLEKQERMFGQFATVLDRLSKRLDQTEEAWASLSAQTTQSETSTGDGSSGPADDPFEIEPTSAVNAQKLDVQWTDEIPGLRIQHTRDGIVGVYDTPQSSTQDIDEIQRAQAFAEEEFKNSLVKLLDLQGKFLYQHDVRIERLYDALRARQ